MSNHTRPRTRGAVPLLLLLAPTPSSAQEGGRVWFAQVGADGDGTSATSPLGSAAELESSTAPGDVLVLLIGETPLDGGLALKLGQDGVIGVAALVPARVDVEISDSVIEGAAQSNVEGTILNVPPFDPLRADETRVSVRVVGSTLRRAGGTDAFEGQRANVFIGSSATAQQLDPTSSVPFPAGRYRLEVRGSRIEGALDHGLIVGNPGSVFGIAPEGASFEVLLRDNEILSNGSSQITLRAPRASVDARQNCWGTPDGLSEDRLVLVETAERSQVDAAQPLACDMPPSE